jgi:hypothetical protein
LIDGQAAEEDSSEANAQTALSSDEKGYEEMTIDGKVEKETTRKERGNVGINGDVVKTQDGGQVRRTSSGEEERMAHDPGGTEQVSSTPML